MKKYPLVVLTNLVPVCSYQRYTIWRNDPRLRNGSVKFRTFPRGGVWHYVNHTVQFDTNLYPS